MLHYLKHDALNPYNGKQHTSIPDGEGIFNHHMRLVSTQHLGKVLIYSSNSG